jgi:hypothetical protein
MNLLRIPDGCNAAHFVIYLFIYLRTYSAPESQQWWVSSIKCIDISTSAHVSGIYMYATLYREFMSLLMNKEQVIYIACVVTVAWGSTPKKYWNVMFLWHMI